MLNWLEGLAGPQFATAALWTFAALVLLVVVLIIVRLVRSLTFGTFVAGGRNRKTRLAVMDATAVDSHRRLVLVRRDDVEHLIMIGGPTDVVVERDIRLGQPRRAALTGGESPDPQRMRPEGYAPAQQPLPHQLPPQQLPAQQIAIPQPRPQPQPQRPVAPTRPVAPQRPAAAREQPPQPRPQPQRAPAPAPVAAVSGAAAYLPPQPAPYRPTHQAPALARQEPKAQPRNGSNLDDTLLRELEVSFDSPPPPPPARSPARPREMTVDDEMTKLLGELSSQQR